jgi:hypothetical protein
MGEPESIPIHDLPTEPGSETVDAGPSATERGIDFLAGVVSFGAGLVVSALDGEQTDGRSAGLAAFVAAGAGLFLEGLRAAAPMLGSIERTAGPTIGSTGASESVGELLDHWRRSWDDRHEDDRQRAADEQLRATFQRAVDTLLDQLDLTTLVVDHLDVQRVASTIDMNALVAGLDVNALAAQIDMERLTDRIDIDALVARLDVEALLARLDIPAIAAEVIDELDLLQTIRAVSADTASEGVRDVRLRGVGADRAIQRAVDRLLSRSDGPAR